MYQKFRRWNNLKITQYVAHLEYIIPSFALLQISVILNPSTLGPRGGGRIPKDCPEA